MRVPMPMPMPIFIGGGGGISKDQYLEALTQLMGEIVEDELTKEDKEKLAEYDMREKAINKKERRKSRIIGTTMLFVTLCGAYKLASNYGVVAEKISQFFDLHENFSPAWLETGVAVSGLIVSGAALLISVYYLCVGGGVTTYGADRRKIYMKYQNAREILYGNSAEHER